MFITPEGKIGYNTSNGIFVGAEAGGNATTPAGNYFNGYIGNIIINNNSNLVSGTTYNTITAPAQNVTLYAKWEPTNYTITYNLGGGSATNPGNYNIESNEITLNNPTKRGYTFTGWSGTGLTGTTNKTVKIATGSTGNRTYTANYTKDVYTISYTLNGGSVATANPTSYSVDTAAFTLTNPTKEGWTFEGWSGTGLSGNTNKTVTIPVNSIGNRSYVAHFSKVVTLTQKHGTSTTTQNYTMTDSETSHTFTLVTSKDTFEGWTFEGWLNNGTPKAPDYGATGTVTISADKTVYATYSRVFTNTFIDYNGTTKTTNSIKSNWIYYWKCFKCMDNPKLISISLLNYYCYSFRIINSKDPI